MKIIRWITKDRLEKFINNDLTFADFMDGTTGKQNVWGPGEHYCSSCKVEVKIDEN